MAAGALLVREAGGVVTDWTGDPDAWLGSGDIVAAPPRVHARLLEITARADRLKDAAQALISGADLIGLTRTHWV